MCIQRPRGLCLNKKFFLLTTILLRIFNVNRKLISECGLIPSRAMLKTTSVTWAKLFSCRLAGKLCLSILLLLFVFQNIYPPCQLCMWMAHFLGSIINILNCSNFFKFVLINQNHSCSNLVKLFQICTSLVKLVQTDPSLFKLVLICSNLFKSSPILSKVVQTC